MKQLNRNVLSMISGGGDTPGATTGASITAVGAGIGAARAVEAAGSLGAMGQGAVAVGGALAAGLAGAATLGYEAGSFLYEHSEMVREVSQGTVANVMEKGFFGALREGLRDIGDTMFGRDDTPKTHEYEVNYE
jgi:hypothetical protein